jgi:hypothetical protein
MGMYCVLPLGHACQAALRNRAQALHAGHRAMTSPPPCTQVSYLVAPGARIAVGSRDNCVACSFQEGGSSGVAEMMLKARRCPWPGLRDADAA